MSKPFTFDYAFAPPQLQDIDTMRRMIREYEEVYGYAVLYYPLKKRFEYDKTLLEQRIKDWDGPYTMKAFFDFMEESISISLWGSEHIETLDLYFERSYFHEKTQQQRNESFSTTESLLVLSYFPVLEGSVTVYRNGNLLTEGTDYTVDYAKGEVQLASGCLGTPCDYNVQYTSYYEPTIGDIFKIYYNGLVFEVTNVAQENPKTIFFGQKLMYALTARIFEPSHESEQLEEELQINSQYSENEDIEEESDTIYDYPPDEEPFGDY